VLNIVAALSLIVSPIAKSPANVRFLTPVTYFFQDPHRHQKTLFATLNGRAIPFFAN
jgi:hypothetical protein